MAESKDQTQVAGTEEAANLSQPRPRFFLLFRKGGVCLILRQAQDDGLLMRK
jgi:hypothetical protein